MPVKCSNASAPVFRHLTAIKRCKGWKKTKCKLKYLEQCVILLMKMWLMLSAVNVL